MSRPAFVQSPTIRQQVAVFNMYRAVRKLVAEAKIPPADAVELRAHNNILAREFDLSFWDETGELKAVRDSDPQWREVGR